MPSIDELVHRSDEIDDYLRRLRDQRALVLDLPLDQQLETMIALAMSITRMNLDGYLNTMALAREVAAHSGSLPSATRERLRQYREVVYELLEEGKQYIELLKAADLKTAKTQCIVRYAKMWMDFHAL